MVNGADLRALREQKGYSQEGLADKVGVSRRSVVRWENGNCSVPVGRLAMLALELDVTYGQLLHAISMTEAADAQELVDG